MFRTASVGVVLSWVFVTAAALCPPLESNSVDFFCLMNGDDVGNCSAYSQPLTKARFECKPGYYLVSEPAYWFSVCQKDDRWDHEPFECLLECGIRHPPASTQATGSSIRLNEFPWHVAIYEQRNGAYEQICGGSIISPSIVVSAAHCFYNDRLRTLRDPARFKVVAGKYHGAYDAVDRHSQERDVHNVTLPLGYRGRERNYRFDFAVVRLAVPLEMTVYVNIVCVAWQNEGQRNDFKSGRNGTVPGWRFQESVTHLQSVDLPFVPFDECYNVLTEEARPLYTPDKFCGGYHNGNVSVCPGDSGSGMVFWEATTGRYFLRGIVSVSFKPSIEPDDLCYRGSFSTFTNLAEYRYLLPGPL